MPETNRQLVLRDRPTDEVGDEHFELLTAPLPEPGDGEVLLRTQWLSFDPAQRGWLNDVRSYVPPVAIGEPMRAYGIGEVVTSNAEGVKPGDLVHTSLGWQDYAVVNPAETLFEPVPAAVTQPEIMLGLLGMTGLTAYFGMTDVGRPVEGDAVLVTAAAGATGSIAGQIARIKGAAQVIGTAGAEQKRAWVRDVAGFDDCLDHYDENILRLIRAANREGYQVVFDNVGGTLLDACLFNIAVHARTSGSTTTNC
jgi:NADPH-dependent curcumin reductase CurA